MSDPQAIPDDERPMLAEEILPDRASADVVDDGRADATAGGEKPEDRGDDQDDDSIDVEDLP